MNDLVSFMGLEPKDLGLEPDGAVPNGAEAQDTGKDTLPEDGPAASISDDNSDCSSYIVPIDDVAREPGSMVGYPRMLDHFTIPHPSSGVRFQQSNINVYDQNETQLVIRQHATAKKRSPDDAEDGEQSLNLTFTVKQVDDTSYGLSFLRASYTLVAVFVVAFTFIFALELLLFLFIDLAIEVGATELTEANPSRFVGILFSVPVFIYGLSMFMTIATSFVTDTWYGHPFLRTFGNWSSASADWISVLFFLMVPIFAFIVTLMQRRDDWWEVSTLTWFVSVLIYLFLFVACVIFYQVKVALQLVSNGNHISLFARIKSVVLSSVSAKLAGHIDELHMMDGSETDIENDSEPQAKSVGLYTRTTQWKIMSCLYKTLDQPQRYYTLDEARGITPFATRDTWSLEKLFCRDTGKGGRMVAIVTGPSAITRGQAVSSLICMIVGLVLFLLLVAGLLVWMGAGGSFLAVALVLLVICALPRAFVSLRLWKLYQKITTQPTHDNHENHMAIYQVWQTKRVTEPVVPFAWFVLLLQIVFFYVWPLSHLIRVGNPPGAIFFAILGLFHGSFYYLDASVHLRGAGNFSDVGNKSGARVRHGGILGVESKKEWRKKSRLSQIVQMGHDKSKRFWTGVFIGLVAFFVLTVLAAFATTSNSSNSDVAGGFKNPNDQFVLVEGFEYEPHPNLPYPTCTLNMGLDISYGEASDNSLVQATEATLTDYAFMANIAYVRSGGAQYLLNQWLGVGVAKENVQTVADFKAARGLTNSVVSYKMITFANAPEFAIVSIRGTNNLFDLMADAQLWLGASLFQLLRAILPMGGLWTPILNNMVWMVSVLETESIKRVAFYTETSEFVEYLKESGNFTTIHVTGHSLGGGLALITGAQTNTTAVGLSAPNALLSRDSFNPPISEETLDTYTFNIIPARDVIPMLDDTAELFQQIECRAPANEFYDCHTSSRSLCDLAYYCGSGSDRPVLCGCPDMGYPEPTPIAGSGSSETFAEACTRATRRGEEAALLLDQNEVGGADVADANASTLLDLSGGADVADATSAPVPVPVPVSELGTAGVDVAVSEPIASPASDGV